MHSAIRPVIQINAVVFVLQIKLAVIVIIAVNNLDDRGVEVGISEKKKFFNSLKGAAFKEIMLVKFRIIFPIPNLFSFINKIFVFQTKLLSKKFFNKHQIVVRLGNIKNLFFALAQFNKARETARIRKPFFRNRKLVIICFFGIKVSLKIKKGFERIEFGLNFILRPDIKIFFVAAFVQILPRLNKQ